MPSPKVGMTLPRLPYFDRPKQDQRKQKRRRQPGSAIAYHNKRQRRKREKFASQVTTTCTAVDVIDCHPKDSCFWKSPRAVADLVATATTIASGQASTGRLSSTFAAFFGLALVYHNRAISAHPIGTHWGHSFLGDALQREVGEWKQRWDSAPLGHHIRWNHKHVDPITWPFAAQGSASAR